MNEPGGLDLLPDGRLLVADTNNHRIVTVDIGSGAVVEIPVGTNETAGQEPGAVLSGAAGASLPVRADLDLGGVRSTSSRAHLFA